MYLNAEIIVLS